MRCVPGRVVAAVIRTSLALFPFFYRFIASVPIGRENLLAPLQGDRGRCRYV